MSLRVKFNLILLLSFAIGYAATSYIAYVMLQKNAREIGRASCRERV